MDEHWRLEKLIRDRLPELLRDAGQPAQTRIVDDAELRHLLAHKLLEEAREAYQAFQDGDAETLTDELADVLAVLERMAELAGVDWAAVRARQAYKARERGGFATNRALALDPGMPRRLYAGPQRPLLQVLRQQLAQCRAAYFAVAFVMQSGLEVLGNAFAAALTRGARIRLLTTDYLDITEPEALERLIRLPGDMDVRLYREAQRSYHPKAYLFEHARPGRGLAFIGSSNLSRSALETGIEWNYEVRDEDGGWPLHDFIGHFQALFEGPHSEPVTPERIAAYRARRRPRTLVDAERALTTLHLPSPRPAQVEALAQLSALRAEGETRALVIAATGIGKTYLAAFDSRGFGRVLFIAHRLELLTQAEHSFRAVRPWDTSGFYQSERQDAGADLLFASLATLAQAEHLARFARDAFDYVVVDEFHHAAAASYKAILAHFRPRFLLGLTATPYRGDNRDIFTLCDGNIAYRLTLFEAIGFGWLCPFRYYGLYDATDYSAIPWRRGRYVESALSEALANQARASAILAAFARHPSRAALGFCVSIAHARFMAEYFSAHGVAARAVHSGAESLPRESALAALRAGRVRVLFTVDLFNEGVDIPELDLVLFLRPTESMTVFVQQLGRGLRLAEGKAYLTALDFIGNYRNAHYKLAVLAGKDDPETANARPLLKALAMGSFGAQLPAGVEVHFDLEAIDLLAELVKKGEPLRERLRAAFMALQEVLGHRPALLEVERQGRYPVRQYRQAFGSWFGFLGHCGALTPAEATLEREVGAFLVELEKTAMTKSYKMVVLLSVVARDGLQRPLTIGELLADFRRFFAHPQYTRDLQGTPVEALGAVSDRDLRRYLETNPLKAWAGSAFFTYDPEAGALRYTGPAAGDPLSFRQAVEERARWRLAAYFERKYVRHTVFRVISAGDDAARGIIMLGDDPRAPVPRGQGWKVVLIDGEPRYAKFAKIAINVLKDRPSDDKTVPNRLTEVLEGWFGPQGYRPEYNHAVRITPAPVEEDVWLIEPHPVRSPQLPAGQDSPVR